MKLDILEKAVLPKTVTKLMDDPFEKLLRNWIVYFSGHSRRGTTVNFKQGLVNKDVNWHLNYVPLPVDPKGFWISWIVFVY